MAQGKVEICGVNTAKLPILAEEEKEALFARIKAGDEKAKEDNHAYCKIAYHVEKRKHHKEGHNCKYAYRESGQDTPAFAYSIEENKKMLFNTRTENNNTDH